jgi:uncharacterized protein
MYVKRSFYLVYIPKLVFCSSSGCNHMDTMIFQLTLILLVQGPLWVVGHCPGMCGPLILAIGLPRTAGVLAYQTGKAATYAVLGALAGALGGGVSLWLRSSAPVLLMVIAGAMIIAGLLRILPLAPMTTHAAPTRWLTPLVQRAGRCRGPAWLRAALLGMVLALLPCSVVVWVLGLAIAAANPWHGALLTSGLVLLTTPVLVVIHLLHAQRWMAHWRQRVAWLPGAGLMASGLWMLAMLWWLAEPACGP